MPVNRVEITLPVGRQKNVHVHSPCGIGWCDLFPEFFAPGRKIEAIDFQGRLALRDEKRAAINAPAYNMFLLAEARNGARLASFRGKDPDLVGTSGDEE